MVYEKFKEVIDAIRKADDFMENAHKIGIDLIDSPIYEVMPSLYRPFFSYVFGEDGNDWIEWYLYELPTIRRKGHDKDEVYATDSDGKPIDVSSDKSFYDFLVRDYLFEK